METSVPAGIDYEGVSKYFAQNIAGGDVPLTITLISGGRSNITYKVVGGGKAWVLRRPPLGHVLPTAHDMVREYRVISALGQTDVPVPVTVALCEDTSVNGAPFYVMDFMDGYIGDQIPEDLIPSPESRRAVGLGMIRTLAKLHAVDYTAIGLGEFGRPDGYLERQVRRWSEQWERSMTRPLPEIDEVIRRLKAALPESPAPTIVHGDYRLGNMMMSKQDPGQVIALLDWEMSTLGDPLTDVGYTLLYWVEPGDPPESVSGTNFTTAPGFLTRQELIDEYAKASGRSIAHVDYYTALAAYKLAVIVEGIHARFLMGQTVGEGFEGYGERCEALVRRALHIMDNSSDPKLRA